MAAFLLEHDDCQRYPSLSLVSVRPTIHEKYGRRRVRRRDNSRFVGNEHIVEPSLKDYEPPISLPRTTFPIPLPRFISRASPSISAIPCRDPITANAGRYSLSLKGIRKRLRKAGPRTEQLVSEIDGALTAWLHAGAVIIQPDIPLAESPGMVELYADTSQSIQEISRSALQLIWKIDDDFSRFLLHCVARFYGIVSYSKTVNDAGREVRVTYLLRPNVTRPDFKAASRLETPPATDIEGLSTPADTDNDSDALSDTSEYFEENLFGRNVATDVDEGLPTVIEEDSDEATPYVKPNRRDSGVIVLPTVTPLHGDGWSEDERRGNHRTRTAITDFEFRRNNRNISALQTSRSTSSPSRSPGRPYRSQAGFHRLLPDKQLNFWHYVYG